MAIRLVLPLLLIFAGILLLLGCLPVPATHELQPNLKPRPETSIGAEPDKPIQLGRTRIDDAFIILSHKVQIRKADEDWVELAQYGQRAPLAVLSRWGVSEDRSQFWVQYDVRTSTDIWPLCFQAIPQTVPQYLILDVNTDGIVTAEHTLDQPPVRIPIQYKYSFLRWQQVFDEPTRRKLYDAGVFPSDEVFDHLRATTQQIEQLREKRIAERGASPATQENRP
jgi:hypothetical protein